MTRLNKSTLNALAGGRHGNPFSLYGLHREGGKRIVRTIQPQADTVALLLDGVEDPVPMQRVQPDGIFEVEMPPRKRHYRFRITQANGNSWEVEDAYRFPSMLGDLDLYLMGQGSHRDIFRKLGAHPARSMGVSGTFFAIWAPNASRVSVVGEFNNWDGRCHVMRLHPGNGLWEIFVPGVGQGTYYKFELLDKQGELLPFKSDPLGQFHEAPPGNASVVYESKYRWRDAEWNKKKTPDPRMDQAISIYEVHLGSWRRGENNRFLTYRELADDLVTYVKEMNFTHVEMMPVTEHPFDGSWGYQPIGMYAPTQRFGDPDDFRFLVDRFHQEGIGVIMDWVPAHFPKDEHGLRRLDGTALYEHEDPRKGEHTDWGTLIFNFGRREVINYLVGSALYWIDSFHIDALRVDAVASMLYLDYSREKGEWVANEFGGNEHLEAVEFLRQLNSIIHTYSATSYAEESTAWPGVSRPTDAGGLGFTYKWNMGWMNDTLAYMSEDPVHRKYHHDKMTFGLVYAFDENFVLPLSHDEVVHGKRSLLGRMPGDEWQRFANLRAYYGFMYAHPGKKLLFMGAEIAQEKEWNHDQSLDWHVLEQPLHQGIQNLVSDLNRVYRDTAALHQLDFSHEGFEWIDWQDADSSVLCWLRRASDGAFVVCVSNFTPLVRSGYRIGVPKGGCYSELLNTDSVRYGGSGVGVHDDIYTEDVAAHGHQQSLQIDLPPLATIMLKITNPV
ncbi:MAG: 1,4-alpha-glucan branching protein GlgB [Xanthomonadales bacterium]|nr:1,4-alpha-glucan branching protein GlgB [Xanthomonadales bacterium]